MEDPAMTNALMETAARFRADPAAARTTPAATAIPADGRARPSSGTFSWDTDLPPSLGVRINGITAVARCPIFLALRNPNAIALRSAAGAK
jgi:hypothetical protein